MQRSVSLPTVITDIVPSLTGAQGSEITGDCPRVPSTRAFPTPGILGRGAGALRGSPALRSAWRGWRGAARADRSLAWKRLGQTRSRAPAHSLSCLTRHPPRCLFPHPRPQCQMRNLRPREGRLVVRGHVAVPWLIRDMAPVHGGCEVGGAQEPWCERPFLRPSCGHGHGGSSSPFSNHTTARTSILQKCRGRGSTEPVHLGPALAWAPRAPSTLTGHGGG